MKTALLTLVAGLALGAAQVRAFNTYTNIAVKTEDRAKVIAALREMQRRAIVSPVKNGYVVVYDAKTEREPDTLPEVAGKLSEAVASPTVAFYNHDDSLLLMYTFDAGRRVDAYVSNPGYFQGSREPARGGDVAIVQRMLGVSGQDEELKNLFASQVYDLEIDRHRELIRVLGLPYYCRGAGHKYFHDDMLPWEYDRKAFEIIGQP